MIQYLQRMRLRRQCLCGKGTVFHPGARIFNMAGSQEAVEIGSFTHIRGELLTFAHGGKIQLGSYCYVGEGTRIWSAASIRIGERVLIAHNVTIMDSLTHPVGATARHEHFKQIITAGHPLHLNLGERPVEIADDAWIGCASVILRGVIIGEGSIVGAGSVVTENVAPWTVVGGNPAKVIRELGPDER